MLTLVCAASCAKPDDPNDGENNNEENDSVVDPNGNLNGHVYVDLGLPSGILWATCNVGANTPEGCGDYFAWGETTPKDVYDWKSYQYGDFVDGRFAMTKYCTVSSWGLNGFVDSLAILEPVDDAATAWGAGWRMPTGKDWDELYHYTTWAWTTQNGVEGRLLTAKNGNSVFLPATGFRLEGELIGPGLGIYWSSSLHTGCPERGRSFHFDFENCHVCGTYERNRGQVVRAVRITH